MLVYDGFFTYLEEKMYNEKTYWKYLTYFESKNWNTKVKFILSIKMWNSPHIIIMYLVNCTKCSTNWRLTN